VDRFEGFTTGDALAVGHAGHHRKVRLGPPCRVNSLVVASKTVAALADRGFAGHLSLTVGMHWIGGFAGEMSPVGMLPGN
jgi:hypothetical protein